MNHKGHWLQGHAALPYRALVVSLIEVQDPAGLVGLHSRGASALLEHSGLAEGLACDEGSDELAALPNLHYFNAISPRLG